MVSIAPLLEVPFDDTISADECLARNRLDAATRSVVWDAEKLVLDEIKDDGAHEKTVEPVGVRDAEGVVRSVEEVERWEGMGELRRKVGLEEEEGMVFAKGVAKGVGSRGKVSDNEALRKAVRRFAWFRLSSSFADSSSFAQVSTTESTSSQPGPSTQVSPVISRAKSSRPPVPFFNESQEDYSQRYAAAASTSQGASFEDSYEKLETVEEDIEMADASLESLGSEVVQRCVLFSLLLARLEKLTTVSQSRSAPSGCARIPSKLAQRFRDRRGRDSAPRVAVRPRLAPSLHP